MRLSIREVIDKIDTLDAVIKWAEQYDANYASEHEHDFCENNINLLKEYREIIMNTPIDL